MKLLLTSSGLSNKSIEHALENLLEKPARGVKLAFVPTAANVVEGDKSWLVEDLSNCIQAGYEVDIVDISAVSQSRWLPRLESAEVILFGGGNNLHLMYWVKGSGLADLLPKLLRTQIYVGISAGSSITGPTVYNAVQNLYEEKYEMEIIEGLNLVNFQTSSHLNSPYFEKIRKEYLEKAAVHLVEPTYALDDNSAIISNGTTVEIVSEGEWYKFN